MFSNIIPLIGELCWEEQAWLEWLKSKLDEIRYHKDEPEISPSV